MVVTTYSEAVQSIDADYKPYSNTIDRQVAAECTCTACGHVGLSYRGWRRQDSYRAFAICPSCGHTEEF